MCGIFGCLNFENKELDLARKSLSTLEHRGRDQWNDWVDRGIYFGHRRLSILDLSEQGRQPFANSVALTVVNGEIYNYKQIKNELNSNKFKSNSDSEVILHGYNKWGIDTLLEKLDGMYAFAVYDRKKKKLILAKDKWGKKPLFYAIYKKKLIFASEIKAIFEFAPDLRNFSFEGIKHWISYRGSHNKQTIYSGIYRIAPGTYIEIDHELDIKEVKYYNILDKAIENPILSIGDEEVVEIIDDKLSHAVLKRLNSDVPLGLQLSGGIDSSLIAYYLKKLNYNSKLHSFSVGFSENKYTNYSESAYSKFVSDKWEYSHHDFGITQEMIGKSFEDVLYIFDGMLDYPNAIPLYLLNKFSKDYISVSLTGEASDELFGGYRKYLNINNLDNKKYPSAFFPDLFFKFSLNNKINTRILRPLYLNKEYGGRSRKIVDNFNAYISPKTIESLFGPQKLSYLNDSDYDKLDHFSLTKQVLLVDHMTYLYSLLDRQDRTSMGANIEARLPFMDYELVEWVIRLNPEKLFNNRQTKIPLKKLSAKIYGNEFTNRKKMGFPLPLDEWLQNDNCFGKYYNKIFDNDFMIYNYIDKRKLTKWFKDYSFSNKLINYSDSEKMWMKWFLMVLRISQDIFRINDIKPI